MRNVISVATINWRNLRADCSLHAKLLFLACPIKSKLIHFINSLHYFQNSHFHSFDILEISINIPQNELIRFASETTERYSQLTVHIFNHKAPTGKKIPFGRANANQISEAFRIKWNKQNQRTTIIQFPFSCLDESQIFPPKRSIWCNRLEGPTARPTGESGGHVCCSNKDLCNLQLKPIIRDYRQSPVWKYSKGGPLEIRLLSESELLHLVVFSIDPNNKLSKWTALPVFFFTDNSWRLNPINRTMFEKHPCWCSNLSLNSK